MKRLYLSLLFVFFITSTKPTLANDFNQVYQDYSASQKTDNHQQTLNLAKQAVTLGKAKFGESDLNSINLTYNLATAYNAAKEHKNAFDTMQIVTDDFAKRYGEHSEKLFTALLEQLNFYPTGNLPDVIKQDKTLANKVRQVIDVADTLAEQSAQKAPYIYYQLSKVLARGAILERTRKNAFKYTEMAYESLLASVGKKDHRTMEIQLTLASIKNGLGKTNRAIELYEDLIDNIAGRIDTSHPYELAARSRLVAIYEGKRQSEKATQHCLEIGKMTPWQQDIDPIPLYRVAPNYPVEQARKGKQGWAKMSFSIDEMGFAKDIEVIEVKGGSLFARASKKALEQWRYAPKFENGQATVAENMTVQLDFKLSKTTSMKAVL